MATAIWIATSAGNWSTATNWSTLAVPAAGDDVQIGNGVGATQFDCTIDVNTNIIRSLNCTNYTKNLTINANVTLGLGGASAGNFILDPAQLLTINNATTSQISFAHTTTGCSVNFAGKTAGNVTFNGVGGGWTLTDQFNTLPTSTVTLTAGTLNTTGTALTHSWGIFSSSGSGVRTMTITGSPITLTGANTTVWNMGTATNATVNASGSTITCNGSFAGFTVGTNVYTFGTLIMSGAGSGTLTITAGTTFGALTRTGTATKGDQFTITNNLTVTGALTLNSNSATNRLQVLSNTQGTARTITAGSLVATNIVDFMDITGAGAATWTTAGAGATAFGDCGGNSGITFTTAVQQTWSGTSGGNWSTNAWTTRVPLPQDNVVISSAFIASQTVTIDMPRCGNSINFTGVSGSPTVVVNTTSRMFGSLTLAAGIGSFAPTSALLMNTRGSSTLTTNGVVLAGTSVLQAAAINGTITLQDNLTSTSTGGFNVLGGTFTANGKNLTAVSFAFGGAGYPTYVLNMGSGTWTATGSGTAWNISIFWSGTVNASTSTIVLSDTTTSTKTFAGGGFTYNNFTINPGKGNSATITLTGANTFGNLAIGAPNSVIMPASTTTTVSHLYAIGIGASQRVTFTSSSPGTRWTISCANQVSCDWLSLTDSATTGAGTFYAGPNSTGAAGANNTGWTFTFPSSAINGIQLATYELAAPTNLPPIRGPPLQTTATLPTPSVEIDTAPGSASTTASGSPPVVTGSASVSPPTANATATFFTPSVNENLVLNANEGQIIASGSSPGVEIDASIPVASSSASASGPTPLVSPVAVVGTSSGSSVNQSVEIDLSAPSAVSANPDVAPLLSTNLDIPTGSAVTSLPTPIGRLDLSAPTASAVASTSGGLEIDILPNAASAQGTSSPPVLEIDVLILAVTANATASGAGPSVNEQVVFNSNEAQATASVPTPSIKIDAAIPSALASASADPPGLEIDLGANVALSLWSAPSPSLAIDTAISVPTISAAANFPTPGLEIDVSAPTAFSGGLSSFSVKIALGFPGQAIASFPTPNFTIGGGIFEPPSGGGGGGVGGGSGFRGGAEHRDKYILPYSGKARHKFWPPSVFSVDHVGDDQEEEEIVMLALKRFGMI